LVIALLLKLL